MGRRDNLKPIFRKWPRWALKISAYVQATVMVIPIGVEAIWPELRQELDDIDRMDD